MTAHLVADCLGQNLHSMALHMLLMFALYLRPTEALRIRKMDVVPPIRRGGIGYQCWCIVLHPLECGRPSKTKEFDESLMLDLEYHKEIGPALYRFSQQMGKTKIILKHTLGELQTYLQQAQERLDLGPLGVLHPYRFRHGGANHDFAHKLRDLPGIQQRGRWQSQASVRRYQKGARLSQVFGTLSVETQNRCIESAKSLPRLLATQL